MRSAPHLDGKVAAPPARSWGLTVGTLLTGAVVWTLLGTWPASGSERFFLLVPPVVWTLSIVRPGKRLAGKWRLGIALIVSATLTILCVGYNLVLTAPLFAVADGWLRGLSVREVTIALYFLLALYLIAACTRRAVRPPMLRAVNRLAHRLPGGGRVLSVALAESVFLLGFAPFLVGTFHVHRFKVPNPERPAELADRPFEDMQFTAEDGLVLRGWFLPADRPSERTLLICHGMGTNRTAVLPYHAVGDALGANVLLFDFRGHGDSDGHTVSFGQYEKRDVRAAVQFLRTTRPEQARKMIGLGISMGTAGLIAAAAELEVPFDAVVLDSGFAAAADLTDHLLREVPTWLRQGLAFPAVPLASLDSACWLPGLRPVDSMSRLRAPVLLIHAQDDRLIPASHSRRLFDAANEPRALWLADTGGHGSAFDRRAEYLDRVTRFIRANGRGIAFAPPPQQGEPWARAGASSVDRSSATGGGSCR